VCEKGNIQIALDLLTWTKDDFVLSSLRVREIRKGKSWEE
jgi:hypothetical protein